MRREHQQVLQTLAQNACITKQMLRSIKGQLFTMTDAEREDYLKKIISRVWKYPNKHIKGGGYDKTIC